MRDPAYRLPTTTRPRHYEVNLTPYFDNVTTGITPFTFDGAVTIYLSPTQANVSEIVMHCNDLTIYTLAVTTIVNGVEQAVATTGGVPSCEMPYAFLRITTSSALVTSQEYIVRMTFMGNLQTNMRGFYRSWYVDSTQRRLVFYFRVKLIGIFTRNIHLILFLDGWLPLSSSLAMLDKLSLATMSPDSKPPLFSPLTESPISAQRFQTCLSVRM